MLLNLTRMRASTFNESVHQYRKQYGRSLRHDQDILSIYRYNYPGEYNFICSPLNWLNIRTVFFIWFFRYINIFSYVGTGLPAMIPYNWLWKEGFLTILLNFKPYLNKTLVLKCMSRKSINHGENSRSHITSSRPQTTIYCKFVNFHENFIFANAFKNIYMTFKIRK